MSKGMSAGRVRLAYQFIEAHRREYRVQMRCRLLEVASSGYYAWLHNPVFDRAKEDARLQRALIHSDQGPQYGSYAWRRFCRSHGLEPSMSRKGNCGDNAVAESFFSSLKKKRVKKQIYRNRELAIADLCDYIEAFYNRTRQHSYLGGHSPEQFEAAHSARRKGVH